MTVSLQEPFIIGLRDRLETQLPATIDALNSAMVAPIYPLVYPAKVIDYIPTVAELDLLPVIGISDGDIYFQDDVGWGATGVFDVTVVAFVQAPDQRELVWLLRRYSQALVRVMLSTQSIGDSWGITLRHVRPGPTLGRDETPRQWLSTTAVTVTVKNEQDE